MAVHLGTGLAAVTALAAEWQRLLMESLGRRSGGGRAARRTLAAILLATMVVALAGLAVEPLVESALRRPWIVAVTLIAGGLALYAADRFGKQRGQARDEEHGLPVWLAIGLAQMVALVPGVSRSGITITVARALGVSRVAATRYSFLLMAPVILGAAGLRGFRLVQQGASGGELALLATAAVVSGVAGVMASRWLLRYVRTSSFAVFAVYRAALGIGALALVAIRG